MERIATATLTIASLALAVRPSAAQRVTIVGTAYDSLHDRPLVGALITIGGNSEAATSDSAGHFSLGDLAVGKYTFRMFHSAFDSLGVPGSIRSIDIHRGLDTVKLWLPSFATLWSGMCGGRVAPTDSAFVFGTIRDAARRLPQGGASVTVSWLDVRLDSASVVSYKWRRGEVRSNSSGEYVICGMPRNVFVREQARSDSLETGIIDLSPSALGVQRLDLLLGSPDSVLSARRGVIVGSIRDDSGRPIADADVSVTTAHSTRSRRDGGFILVSPLGTRQLNIRAVGLRPASAIVEVVSGDTARANIVIHKVTSLAPMQIIGGATSVRRRQLAEIQDRRKEALGHYMDSTSLEHFLTIPEAMSMIGSQSTICLLYIDGVRYVRGDIGRELRARDPRDIALIEQYRGYLAPIQYRPPTNCDVALVWTKNWLP